LTNDRPHKIRPRDFCFHLLTKSILETYFCGLQLCNLCVQLVALARFQGDFCPYFAKGVLESVWHKYIHSYTPFMYSCQA